SEAADPPVGSDRVEAVPTAGDQLVRIALVARVPDETVVGKVEDPVERERDLDDSEVRPEVAAVSIDDLGDPLADLCREALELGEREPLEVMGMVYVVENLVHRPLLSRRARRSGRDCAVSSSASASHRPPPPRLRRGVPESPESAPRPSSASESESEPPFDPPRIASPASPTRDAEPSSTARRPPESAPAGSCEKSIGSHSRPSTPASRRRISTRPCAARRSS